MLVELVGLVGLVDYRQVVAVVVDFHQVVAVVVGYRQVVAVEHRPRRKNRSCARRIRQ